MGSKLDLYERLVAEGRVYGFLNAERNFIESLDGLGLVERASKVNGYIEGHLKAGRWGTGLDIVYGNSELKQLFDGDYDGFHEGVVESAKIADRRLFNSDQLRGIIRNHPEAHGMIASMIAVSPTRYTDGKVLAGQLNLDNDAKRDLYLALGRKVATENGGLSTAVSIFREYGYEEGIDKMLDEAIIGGEANFELVSYLAGDDTSRQQKALGYILGKKDWEIGEDISLLRNYLRKNSELTLSDEDTERLDELAVQHLRDVSQEPDHIKLRWAKAHAGWHSGSAYLIMKQLSYRGEEKLAAVKFGLEKSTSRDVDDRKRGLRLDDVESREMVEVYSSLQGLDIKLRVAEHLGDSDRLRDLSQEFAAASGEGKTYDQRTKLGQAYNLWLNNGGDVATPFLEGVRAKLIDSHLRLKTINRGWMHERDVRAAGLYLERVLSDENNKREWGEVYAFAKETNPNALPRVRERVLNAGMHPLNTLELFRGVGDEDGIEMIMGQISSTLGIDREVWDSVYEETKSKKR